MGVYEKQPKKISRLIISDIEKLMFYYRQKYITVFYGFIRCNKVLGNYRSESPVRVCLYIIVIFCYLSSKTYFVSLLTLLLNPSQIRLFG